MFSLMLSTCQAYRVWVQKAGFTEIKSVSSVLFCKTICMKNKKPHTKPKAETNNIDKLCF